MRGQDHTPSQTCQGIPLASSPLLVFCRQPWAFLASQLPYSTPCLDPTALPLGVPIFSELLSPQTGKTWWAQLCPESTVRMSPQCKAHEGQLQGSQS